MSFSVRTLFMNIVARFHSTLYASHSIRMISRNLKLMNTNGEGTSQWAKFSSRFVRGPAWLRSPLHLTPICYWSSPLLLLFLWSVISFAWSLKTIQLVGLAFFVLKIVGPSLLPPQPRTLGLLYIGDDTMPPGYCTKSACIVVVPGAKQKIVFA